MKIYYAGNFVQSRTPEQEEKVQRTILHNRLISFFYKDPWALSVIQVFKKLKEENHDSS